MWSNNAADAGGCVPIGSHVAQAAGRDGATGNADAGVGLLCVFVLQSLASNPTGTTEAFHWKIRL